jgi:uncharacterized protein (TIGR03083 family)
MTRGCDMRPAFTGDDERLALLESEGALFVATARVHDLAALVPGCPGWTLRELIAHLGLVYRWVTRVVRDGRPGPPDRAERCSLEDPDPGDGSALVERAQVAHADLVDALRAAPPDLDCWTVWPAASARSFWIRRQLFETLVHRVDAQNSAAARVADGADLVPRVAADGVDEMVCGFLRRYAGQLRADTGVTLALHATDTDGRWWIRLGPDAPTSGRGAVDTGPRDAQVEATVGELEPPGVLRPARAGRSGRPGALATRRAQVADSPSGWAAVFTSQECRRLRTSVQASSDIDTGPSMAVIAPKKGSHHRNRMWTLLRTILTSCDFQSFLAMNLQRYLAPSGVVRRRVR